MAKSLWPDTLEFVYKEVPPLSILKEQAALLGQKTRNLVTAEVDSWVDKGENFFSNAVKSLTYQGDVPDNQANHHFYDVFYLVAPALDNYRFELFRVIRSIEQFYPLKIYSGTLDIKGREVASEEELLGVLVSIFSHEKTMNIIKSMLVQSGWSPQPPEDIGITEDEIPF